MESFSMPTLKQPDQFHRPNLVYWSTTDLLSTTQILSKSFWNSANTQTEHVFIQMSPFVWPGSACGQLPSKLNLPRIFHVHPKPTCRLLSVTHLSSTSNGLETNTFRHKIDAFHVLPYSNSLGLNASTPPKNVTWHLHKNKTCIPTTPSSLGSTSYYWVMYLRREKNYKCYQFSPAGSSR